jgi:hypothetical protein
VGTIVAAGVLTVSGAEEHPVVLETGVYTVATVSVFWLAHGWAQSLGRRAAGVPNRRLVDGLRHELPVLESVIPPIVALTIAAILGESDATAITIAAWVCVGELGLFGALVARRERASSLRIALTAVGCAALGLTMILLKAVVH